MIQLKGSTPDGSPCYFMGLTGAEMSKIVFEGMPLLVQLDGLAGEDKLTLVTIYGQTEQDIIDALAAQGVVVSMPVDSEQQS